MIQKYQPQERGEKRVIHPEEKVRQRRVLCENSPVENRARVAALQKYNFCIVLLFKRFDNLFTYREGVVSHNCESLRPS